MRVAQPVEQRSPKPQVVGSKPTAYATTCVPQRTNRPSQRLRGRGHNRPTGQAAANSNPAKATDTPHRREAPWATRQAQADTRMEQPAANAKPDTSQPKGQYQSAHSAANPSTSHSKPHTHSAANSMRSSHTAEADHQPAMTTPSSHTESATKGKATK